MKGERHLECIPVECDIAARDENVRLEQVSLPDATMLYVGNQPVCHTLIRQQIRAFSDSKRITYIDRHFLDLAFALDKEFQIKLPLEKWTQEINDGTVKAEEYFVLRNLCAHIDALVAQRSEKAA